ncbi:hypothetical protein Godav_021480 [Gossypium davidsonii]|uniref:Uncharacterized protein n=2 Tax=Gossypium TaxID=3633 RepID=A0A7J8R6P0_GOSDV|nr:hypothetical protein [Gossypium davidsonii]MBA0672503.1 hypothetical protein [Gossypium klotzschianum]
MGRLRWAVESMAIKGRTDCT